jgi:hypothetical protein
MTERTKLLQLSERVYGWLLTVYPPEHRCAYGTEMKRAFRDLCRDALRPRGLRGIFGLLEVWLAVLMDTGISALRERGGCMSLLKSMLTRKFTNSPAMRQCAQLFFFGSALVVLVLGVYKLADLKLSEGELFLGLLLVMQLTMTMVVLGMLTVPRTVSESIPLKN